MTEVVRINQPPHENIEASSLPVSLAVPSQEEVHHKYAEVAARIGVTLPTGISLGQALAAVAMRPNHVVRATHGMYPYTEPLSANDIADRFTLPSVAVAANAIQNGRRGIKRMAERLTPDDSYRLVSLETVAHLLRERSDMLPPHLVDLILATHGLPPYPIPHSYEHIEAERGINKVRHHVKEAIFKLLRDDIRVRDSLESLPIPDPAACETAYAAAANAWGLDLPKGVSFGQVLAHLVPKSEHMIRAYSGLYPFEQSCTPAHVASLYNTSLRQAEKARKEAPSRLKEAMQRVTGDTFTLEEVARALQEPNLLEPDMQALLKERQGIPPYAIPLSTKTLAQRHNAKYPSDITRFTNQALTLLLGSRTPRKTTRVHTASKPAKDPAPAAKSEQTSVPLYQNTERMTTTYRRLEAGWYAAQLLTFHDPYNRRLAETVLLESLEDVAKMRARPIRRPGGFRTSADYIDPNPSRKDMLHARRHFNPTLDTPEGRQRTHQRLLHIAKGIPAKDIPLLEALAEDGNAARTELIQANLGLALRLASIHGNKDRIFGHHERTLSAAFKGLEAAVDRYDHTLNFQFSTYATNWIILYVRAESAVMIAEDLDTKPHLIKVMWQARKAQTQLTDSAGTPPTPQQIATKIHSTPTAVQKALDLYKQYEDSIQHRQSQFIDNVDQSAQAGHQYEDASSRPVMREALTRAFAASQLSQKQTDILYATYGLPPYNYPSTDAEIAAQYNVSTTVIERQRKAALACLQASPEAVQILYSYLLKESKANLTTVEQ